MTARHLPGHHDQAAHGKGGGPGNPVVTGDVDEAARLLGEGKYVRLESPDQVSVLLDRIKGIADEAEAKGDKAPFYDLCKVTVPKTSLFCVESKGIPRVEMPQLKGKPLPGSKADELPKLAGGRADITDAFMADLANRGVAMTHGEVPASHLKASQNELNGATVAGIMSTIRAGTYDPTKTPTVVSKDGYVVDGHHRWAALVGLHYAGNEVMIPVVRVDADIIDLLGAAKAFAADMGIPQKSVRSLPRFGCGNGGCAVEDRHLAGQHDQKMHSGRHAGPWASGNWSALTPDEIRTRRADEVAAAYPDLTSIEVGVIVHSMERDWPSGKVVTYENGNLSVSFHDGAVGKYEQKSLLRDVDDLMANSPITDRPVHIDVFTPNSAPMSDHTFGLLQPNPLTMPSGFPQALFGGTLGENGTVGGASWTGGRSIMLSALQVGDSSYMSAWRNEKLIPAASRPGGLVLRTAVVTHEWGHLQSPRDNDTGKGWANIEAVHKRLGGSDKGQGGYVSTYGASKISEWTAEAFTEWHVTKGKTENLAAIELAKELGWKQWTN